jgi:hypothetical protein
MIKFQFTIGSFNPGCRFAIDLDVKLIAYFAMVMILLFLVAGMIEGLTLKM